MDLGDQVIYYNVAVNDGQAVAEDQVAIIIGGTDEVFHLVVFPVGGPVRFETASEYDPDWPYNAAGAYYIRPAGEEPPNFGDDYAYVNDPDWVAMERAQNLVYNATGLEQRDEIIERHRAERDKLRETLDKRYGGQKNA